jgi:metal-sulfur cluster biosynthetic enzyme
MAPSAPKPHEPDLRAEVTEAVNQIIDPCSAGVGSPTGIADMGLVKRLEIHGADVEVELITTSPMCLFVGHFEQEVERRISALDWVRSVTVVSTQRTMWDESFMSPAARARLAEKYRRPRANAPPGRDGLGGAT